MSLTWNGSTSSGSGSGSAPSPAAISSAAVSGGVVSSTGRSSGSASSVEDYGQGWTQLTDHGKIYLCKKEKNVFILEGTKSAGFSACVYSGNSEQRQLVESGCFTLTSELKCCPADSCMDSQIYVMADTVAMSDLSSGCDFFGVSVRFDTREVKVENHRRNQSTQTLFAQPGCSLLKPNHYVTISMAIDGNNLSLSMSGVTIVNNLMMNRGRQSGDPLSIGICVYGKTRCYLRRFRIKPYAAASAEQASLKAIAPASSTTASLASRPSQTSSKVGSSADHRDLAADEMDLAATIERDIVTADLNVRFEDIGGLEDAKKAIQEAVLLPLILPEFFTGLRKPWKGVLLFGPPGTGKTMLAKAVASCTENVTFFNCSSATLTSKWRGESEKLLRALFTTARARVPAILFFDELDSLLSQRGSQGEHEASRRFKSEFLIHMDGLLSDQASEAGHLLVLATSNAPWDLDEALRRRLEKRIYIPLPDEAARFKMLQSSLKDIFVAEDVDLPAMAVATEGYSGSDVLMVCREASMNPMRRMIEGLSPLELVQLRNTGELMPGKVPVTNADLEAALASVQPSVAPGDTERYLEWARDFGSK